MDYEMNEDTGDIRKTLRERFDGMHARCYNPNRNRYHCYGGRGIKVCPEWYRNFPQFFKDMSPTYQPGLTIERIDNDADYSPDNCRWATQKEQANNKSNNRLITHLGQTMTLSQWCDWIGIKQTTLQMRINTYGWSIARALTPTEKRG